MNWFPGSSASVTTQLGKLFYVRAGAACGFEGVRCVPSFFFGRHFTLSTENNPHAAFFNRAMSVSSSHQVAAGFATFKVDIQVIAGKENVAVDSLSRVPRPNTMERPNASDDLLEFRDEASDTASERRVKTHLPM